MTESGKASVPVTEAIRPPCGWEDHCPCTCGECIVKCTARSRFTAERSDHNPSYPAAEACEAHLGAVVPWLLEGRDDLTAVVTVRWDQ